MPFPCVVPLPSPEQVLLSASEFGFFLCVFMSLSKTFTVCFPWLCLFFVKLMSITFPICFVAGGEKLLMFEHSCICPELSPHCCLSCWLPPQAGWVLVRCSPSLPSDPNSLQRKQEIVAPKRLLKSREGLSPQQPPAHLLSSVAQTVSQAHCGVPPR